MSIVKQILKKAYVRDEAYYTHVTMGGFKGKYYIDRLGRDEFFASYSNEYKTHDLCIAECVQGYLPVLVDIDIKLPLGDKRRYSEYQLESIVNDYQTVLKSIIKGCNEKHLICFVLEKPAYDTEKNTKNGFHLHFPYVFLSKHEHEQHLIPRVKNIVNKSNIFADLGFEKSGDLIDTCYTRNPWLLYGSKKEEGKQPYVVTKIYNHEREVIQLVQCDFTLYDGEENIITVKKGEEQKYLPQLLSVVGWNRPICEIKTNLPSLIKINVNNNNNVKIHFVEEDKEEEEELKNPERQSNMITRLNMVKKERFQQYDEWFKLLCLMKGNGLKKEDFLRYSKDSGYSGYNEDECLKRWLDLDSRRSLGFPTIHTWLEEDGVDWKSLFCKKKDKMISSLLHLFFTNMCMLSDKDIAEIFFDNYNENLYSTPIGWLHYNDSRGWEIGEDDIIIYPLMKCIGERFNQFVQTMKKKDDEDDKDFNKKKTLLLRETNRLCSYSACNKIIKTAKTLFKNETILKEFDLHAQWFCFSNQKAIDMLTGNIIDVKKEDHILTTCGYPLPPRIDKDVKDAKEIVLSIFGEKFYESYVSMLAYQFQSGNPQQNVFIQTGSAGNGKSILGNIMRMALGLYAGILPIDQLTQNATGRDTANSAMANMRGRRYCQLNEPEDDNNVLTLKVARLKELSGESEISVRQLHQQATMMRVDFTMSILCNEIPKLSKNDGGVERRIKVITYPYKFVDEPTESFHKKRDDNIKTRSESDKALHYGFLWLMMDVFNKTQGKFIISEEVKKDSEQYMKENNPISEYMEKYEPSDRFIRQPILYQKYKENCKYDNKDIVSTKKFTELLIQLKVKIELDSSHGNKVYVKEKPIVYENVESE
jgi:phage/plasmid-associated DNA primase